MESLRESREPLQGPEQDKARAEVLESLLQSGGVISYEEDGQVIKIDYGDKGTTYYRRAQTGTADIAPRREYFGQENT